MVKEYIYIYIHICIPPLAQIDCLDSKGYPRQVLLALGYLHDERGATAAGMGKARRSVCRVVPRQEPKGPRFETWLCCGVYAFSTAVAG